MASFAGAMLAAVGLSYYMGSRQLRKCNIVEALRN